MLSKVSYLRQFRQEHNKLNKLSATQFLEIWRHFDSNGDGCLSNAEINAFLVELVDYLNTSDDTTEPLSDEILTELKDALFDAFDNDKNGKITVDEMAEILPTEENFQLLFKNDNCDISAAEFFKSWNKFDRDESGFIDTKEFPDFLQYIINKKSTRKISAEKIQEYAECLFYLLDTNRDGKLQFSEIMSIFPVRGNLLSKGILNAFAKVHEKDLTTVFEIYEQPGIDYLKRVELDCLLKDLLVLSRTNLKYDEFKRMVLNECNFALNEKIKLKDLKTFLLNISAKN